MGRESIHYGDSFKVLPEIPMLSVTDIKEAPMTGFRTAEENGTGVYVTNRGQTIGVILTKSQYEDLIVELEELRAKSDYIIDEE